MRTVVPINRSWHFKQADQDDEAYRSVAQFPTNVHLDLLSHGLIPDPYLGKNELAVQWVGETAWVYRTSFATPEGLGHIDGRPMLKAVLAFDGLDTFATVVLNGETILETENMFIPERVEVTRMLRARDDERENELVIRFDAAYFRGWKLVEQHPEHRWVCWNGDSSRLPVRKAQYHWGWDWGPVLLTCGPWRPINLELYTSRVADLHVDVDVDGSLEGAVVVARAAVEGSATGVRFELCRGDKTVACEAVGVTEGDACATFQVQKPDLWYPIRYGEQPLYTIHATLVDGDDSKDSMSKRIGLRRAELVQLPLQDQPGRSFFFRINDIPVFCGGSNWIPADNFIPRMSRDRYYDWVRLAAEGGQSMIRVWGGGIYEEEALYDACDEAGLLVWQDFMFGCGNYPAYPAALESVRREAVENVKILRHHPSIVIWAGNNEDYQVAESEGLGYDPEDMDPNSWLKSGFPARYIYEKILPGVCSKLIPNTHYHPGSPWGGKYTADPTAGDIHQWNVWHGSQEKYQNFDKLIGRFVSEFGMEALPSIKTVYQGILASGPSDAERYAQSSTLDFHNKAAGHERRLALYLAENIQWSPRPMESYIYYTQLIQAECVSFAFRLWRREWRGPGKEHCSGALVWQMNDCWPVTSWSICDYYLRPKHAYYAVKREMAPMTIGMARRERTCNKGAKHSRASIEREVSVEIWASNLTLETVRVDCVVKAWDVETGQETFSKTLSAAQLLPANRSTEIGSLPVPVSSPKRGLEDRTVVAAYLYQDGARVARCVDWPQPLKYLHLQQPRSLRVEPAGDGRALLISAEVPVKGLAVECDDDGVRFEDNLVDVVPGERLRIGVRGATGSTAFTTRHLGMCV